MQCPRHFALRYLSPVGVTLAAGPAAGDGTDFHAYRAAYVNHLVERRLREDPEWVERYLDTKVLSPDAADLVARDAGFFRIDPETIFATELFLGCDLALLATESEEGALPGRTPTNPATRLHGTLDLVELAGSVMTIRDIKSGWGRNTDNYEAAHYAGLAFAHFPYVTEIVFEWEYVRVGARLPLRFERAADAGWIAQRMLSAHREMEAAIARFQAGGEPAIDPAAGLCPVCPYSCPAREAVKRGYLEWTPLQSVEDAHAVARLVHTASMYALRGRELLEQYVDRHGPLTVSPRLVAEIRSSVREEFRLSDILAVLGFSEADLDAAKSPKFDVPLKSLKVSATSLKSLARAKKRAGLAAELQRVAQRKPVFEFHLGKPAREEPPR